MQRNARSVADWRRKLTNGEKMKEFHLGGIDNVQGVVEAKKLEEVFPLDWDHLCCETDKKSNIQIKSKNFSGPVEQIQKI